MTPSTFDQALELHKGGALDRAEALYREILAADPAHHGAHHYLGLVLFQKGRPAEAAESIGRAVELHDREAKYFSNLGNARLQSGDVDGALDAYDRAVALDGADPRFRLNRAAALTALGRETEAVEAYESLLEAPQVRGEALNALGLLHGRAERHEEAAACFRDAIAVLGSGPALEASLAWSLERLNDLDGARAAAERALAAQPGHPHARYVLGRILHRLGRAEEARPHIEAFLAGTPDPAERIGATYILGMVLDRLGDAPAAFAAFSQANRLAAASPAFSDLDGGRFLDRVARNHAWFTAERIRVLSARHERPVVASPVFFVGFPRSGTTLMEQVLGAHPDVLTTEEQSPSKAVMAEARRMTGGAEWPACVDALDGAALAHLRDLYWETAREMFGGIEGKILIEKLPLRIVELGFINVLFPEARVVVALRDPRDVCLSCFMQNFGPNDAMANFTDLGGTARTYAAVMDLWRHYRGILDLAWMEYRYEDLVADFDATVRGVLDFLGLPWNDAVTRYAETAKGRLISTPSYRDVSSGLYGRAVGRWRAYGAFLAPIGGELGPFVEAFGYEP